jgi:hypothetical protein
MTNVSERAGSRLRARVRFGLLASGVSPSEVREKKRVVLVSPTS